MISSRKVISEMETKGGILQVFGIPMKEIFFLIFIGDGGRKVFFHLLEATKKETPRDLLAAIL